MMNSTQASKIFLSSLYMAAVEGLFLLAYLLLHPSEPGNAFFWQYSLAKWGVLLGVLLATVALLLGAAHRAIYARILNRLSAFQQDRKTKAIQVVLAILAGAGLLLILTRAAVFGRYQFYYLELLPVIVWLTLACGQFFFAILYIRLDLFLPGLQAVWRHIRQRYVLYLASIGALLLVFVAIRHFNLGTIPMDHHWNETGVPLTSLQIALSLLFGLAFFALKSAVVERKTNMQASSILRRVDFIAFFAIWLLASILWVSEPLVDSPYAPGPYPPNNEIYPILDAAIYDTSAEFGLIGQELGGGSRLDKPFYTFFLFLLKLLSGGAADRFQTLLVIVLALFPPLLYLLGQSLHSREAGTVLALMSIFHEVNAIHSTQWFNAAHVKLTLTEPFMRLMLALLALVLVKAFDRRRENAWLFLCAGGILGLGTLVRYNVWALLPGALILVWIYFWRRWGRALLYSILLFLTFLLSMAGWVIYSESQGFGATFVIDRFLSTVWANRYDEVTEPPPVEEEPPAPPTQQPQEPLPSSTAAPIEETHTPVPAATQAAAAQSTPAPPPAEPGTGRRQTLLERLPPIVYIPVQHFFNNINASFLVLPDSLLLDDLDGTLQRKMDFANPAWIIRLDPGQTFTYLVYLLLIAVGAAAVIQRKGAAVFVPLFVFFNYLLGTAVALTSGGRYVVATVWVLLLFLSVGITQIGKGALKLLGLKEAKEVISTEETGRQPAKTWPRLLAVLAGFTLFGFLSAYLTGWLNLPDRYPPREESEIARDILEESHFTANEIEAFLGNEDAMVMEGRVLYPRYYGAGEGESVTYLKSKYYPRITFTIIGQHGEMNVILPYARQPEFFPNKADAIVVGCRGWQAGEILEPRYKYVNAILVRVSAGEEDLLYESMQNGSLACPVPEPAAP